MVLCLFMTTVLEWGLQFNLIHCGIVFAGSFLSYSFVKKPLEFFKIGAHFYRSLRGAVYFLFSLLFIVLLLDSSTSELPIVMVAGGLVFFYVFPQQKYKNLRRFCGLKIYIVSLSWVLITGVYPFGTFELNSAQYGYLLQRFLLIILATLPFEIRDLDKDDAHLFTLAQTLGTRGVQLFAGILALLISSLSFFLKMMYGIDSFSVIVLLPFYLWSLWQVRLLKTPYFVSFWVELIPFFGLIFQYI